MEEIRYPLSIETEKMISIIRELQQTVNDIMIENEIVKYKWFKRIPIQSTLTNSQVNEIFEKLIEAAIKNSYMDDYNKKN